MFHTHITQKIFRSNRNKEYKYPDQIHKMPIQTCFFDHQIMSFAVEYTVGRHGQHYYIDDDPGKYVEAVKTGNAEEKSTECNGSRFMYMHFIHVEHSN